MTVEGLEENTLADGVFQIPWFTTFFNAFLVGDVLVDSGTRLAGGIVLLLWLNYTAWAVLFGAELNSELDKQADLRAAGGPRAGLLKPARRVR